MNRPPFIVAEAAQGYEGDPGIARLLIRGAAAARADAIKFQVIYADDVAVRDYQHYALFRQLEMPPEEWRALRELADRLGLGFYVDVAGQRAASLAGTLSVDGIKIHSTCFFETPLLDWAFRAGRPVLLSTGGITEEEVCRLLDDRGLRGSRTLTVMHGYQAEPTPVDRNALARIPRLREVFGVEIGFMDHADGGGSDTVALSAMALALGVGVFEKHITLDRALELEDCVSALAPAAFADYVAAMHRLAGAMGDATAPPMAEELAYREKALKRVVAARPLDRGAAIAAEDLALLRPTEPAGLFDMGAAVGRTLARPLAEGAPVRAEDLR